MRARQQAWQSMAHALFPPHACANSIVTSVELVLDAMMPGDVANFAEVLESDDSATGTAAPATSRGVMTTAP